MTVAYDLLRSGNFTQAIETTYTGAAGAPLLGDWFYLFLILPIIVAVQLRTESSEATSLTMIILGLMGGFLAKFPSTGEGAANFGPMIAYVMIVAIGMTMIFFKFVRSR